MCIIKFYKYIRKGISTSTSKKSLQTPPHAYSPMTTATAGPHRRAAKPEHHHDQTPSTDLLGKPRAEWEFHLHTVLCSPANPAASDIIGAIELDSSASILATAGIARKIRIYSLSSLLPESEAASGGSGMRFMDHSAACRYFICAPAKLSSLRFRPDSAGVVTAGDYDGVVTEYDLERRVPIFERDEHGGRRVWSVAYSRWSPPVCASASDDGTAQLWDPRGGPGCCAGVIRPSVAAAPVCSVELDPVGGAGVGVGCADRGAYLYDVRAVSAGPVLTLRGHTRAVTYVRFAEDHKLVTSAADGSHRLWKTGDGGEVRSYRGHVNRRSFVGMSVWRAGGLIGSGSESNEVYVYDLRWANPVWVDRFGSEEEEEGGFVSSVCWGEVEGSEGILVAGGSNGTVKVFVAKRRQW